MQMQSQIFCFSLLRVQARQRSERNPSGGNKKKKNFEVQVLTAVTHFDAIIPHPAPTCVSLLDANYLPVLLLCIFLNHCYRVKRKKKNSWVFKAVRQLQ